MDEVNTCSVNSMLHNAKICFVRYFEYHNVLKNIIDSTIPKNLVSINFFKPSVVILSYSDKELHCPR